MSKSGPHHPPSRGPIVCQTSVPSGDPTGPALNPGFHCTALLLWDRGHVGRPNPLSWEPGSFKGEEPCGWVLGHEPGSLGFGRKAFHSWVKSTDVWERAVVTGQAGAAGERTVWEARGLIVILHPFLCLGALGCFSSGHCPCTPRAPAES